MTSKMTEDFFRPFSEDQAFFAATIAKRMDEFGVEPGDIIAMIDGLARQRRVESAKVQREVAKTIAIKKREAVNNNLKCPQCGDALSISPVNVSKCTNIGGLWKSSIMCLNDDCMFNELSEKTVKELLR